MAAGVHNHTHAATTQHKSSHKTGQHGKTETKGSKDSKATKTAKNELQQSAKTLGGGGGSAVEGASNISGNDLTAVLKGLADVLKKLIEVVEKQITTTGGGGGSRCGAKVNGVWGDAAGSNYKAPAVTSVASTGAKEDSAYEQEVLRLINQVRAEHGLQPVRYNGVLDRAAEKHNNHMASVNRMAHDGIGDSDPGSRIRAEGFRNSWGENVATGQRSPSEVVRDWMNSPKHRENILNPKWSQMGVAYTTTSSGRSYWAQEFGS